jgi:protein TonB
MEVKRQKKAKKFMEKPEYPGGKKALDAFVAENLRYPEDAMKARLEGIVAVAYQVNDDGEVESPTIVKSLSPTCDEEALRIVGLLRYGKARNRGYRLKANCKLNIHFRLAPAAQQPTLNVTYTTTSKPAKPNKTKPSGSGYTITLTVKNN